MTIHSVGDIVRWNLLISPDKTKRKIIGIIIEISEGTELINVLWFDTGRPGWISSHHVTNLTKIAKE
jgi:hypothetical protein